MESATARMTRGTAERPWAWRLVAPLAVVAALVLAPRFGRWVLQDARDWEPNEPKAGQEGPAVSARQVRLFQSWERDGRKAYEFSAQRIDLSPDKRWATLSGVERAVMYRDGKPYLEMSADNVRFDQQTRDWQAQDNLHVAGPDGLSIRSRAASWNNKDQRLDCPESVTARFKGADIRTVGISYDARKGELGSLNTVSLDAPGISVRDTRVVADVKNRVVKLKGGYNITIQPPVLEKYGVPLRR